MDVFNFEIRSDSEKNNDYPITKPHLGCDWDSRCRAASLQLKWGFFSRQP